MISPKEMAKREKEAWIREKKYQSAQWRRKEIIKGLERGVNGFNFTCFQSTEEAIADLPNIEIIIFRTQIDGYNTNPQPGHPATYTEDHPETLIKAPIVSSDDICLKLHDKLANKKPFHQTAWQLDIEKWLNACRETPYPKTLLLGDKDTSTTSYKWTIEYHLGDRKELDNVEPRAASRS